MLEYLGEIDISLGKRCLTLVKNLRAESNSFFDSFREIVEDFINVLIIRESLDVRESRSLSAILTDSVLVAFLISVGTDGKDIEKIKNYVLKTNRHVHANEKQIDFEAALSYLDALYFFTYPYARSLGLEPKRPTANALFEVFASFERDRDKSEMHARRLDERLDRIEARLNGIPDRMQTVTPKVKEKTGEERAKAFLDTSTSELAFMGTRRRFIVTKLALLSLLAVYIFFAFSVSFDAIFTESSNFLVNLIFPAILYLVWFIKLISLKRFMTDDELISRSMFIAPPLIAEQGIIKKRFTVTLAWGALASIFDYIELIESSDPTPSMLGNTVTSLLLAVLSYFIYFLAYSFLHRFSAERISGVYEGRGRTEVYYLELNYDPDGSFDIVLTSDAYKKHIESGIYER